MNGAAVKAAGGLPVSTINWCGVGVQEKRDVMKERVAAAAARHSGLHEQILRQRAELAFQQSHEMMGLQGML